MGARRKRQDAAAGASAAKRPRIDYVREDGLRKVPEYTHEYKTYTKERWLGREIFEVFTKEFAAYSPEYYTQAFKDGKITVNGTPIGADHVLNANEAIVHTATFRENPVVDGDIRIVHEDSTITVVSKPCSIPVHPCGAYRHNSLVSIMGQQRPDIEAFHTTHRLDRLTSGLTLLARTRQSATRITDLFEAGKVHKTYLARVKGQVVEDREWGVTKGKDGKYVVEGYIHCADYKSAKYVLTKDAETKESKTSKTTVEVLARCGDVALVQCFPETGRTHQIRLHLQHLGIPIENDVCYGGVQMDHPECPVLEDDAGKKHTAGIFLHAHRYQSPDWNFVSTKPSWAELGEKTVLETAQKEAKDAPEAEETTEAEAGEAA